jgi:methylated-DNA-[protein]-cysteine S-methyltransferase
MSPLSTAATTVEASTRHVVVDFPIGPLTLVRDDQGLSGLYFPGHWTHPDPARFGRRVEIDDDAGFDDAIGQLHEYFAGDRREFELATHLDGSPTALRVWQRLTEIPYGRTTTYGVLAAQLGGGISARAVGGFVGHNPLSIIVPCHRVVGSTGRLTGYAGGLERKQYLLELENAVPPRLPALW